MRPLRVGIDGRAFESPAPGVRRYLEGLVPALLALDDAPRLVALGGRQESVPAGVGHIGEPAHPPSNAGWTIVGLPRAAARAGVDLVHAPAYTAPWWAGVPVVVTVHDVSYERHPEWYPYRRDWLRRAFYRRSATGAAHILTVSAFSAREITEAYGIAADRITVAPLAASPLFAPGGPAARGALPAGVSPPYVLHVGDQHERRNLAMLVDAVLEARRHLGAVSAVSLVLVGTDRGVGDGLSDAAARAGSPEAVVRLGRVEEEALRSLYQCASAFVYPSRYEGFGLPLVEAMACGVPVIGARAGSIPEVLGDAGILLDPTDGGAWAAAIADVLTSERRREQMRANGLARAREFTWDRTARITLAVYRRVVA